MMRNPSQAQAENLRHITRPVAQALSLCLLGFALLAPAQQNEGKPYAFSTNVRLVVLNASVTDHKGRPISGLEKNNFRVYEDGKQQQIQFFRTEDVPATVGLIIDHSGSMVPKNQDVIAAAMGLVDASNPDDESFAVAFNEQARLVLPPGETFAKSRDELREALSQQMPAGQTALYDAVALGLQQVEKGTAAKRVLVVISDGGDNASHDSAEQILEMARRANALIYCIGIYDPEDRDNRPGVLKRLATTTGGEAFFPDSLRQIGEICLHIARDVRTQYSLGYEPPGAAGNSYRNVRVTAMGGNGEKLHVRARTGYYESTPDSAWGREP